MLVWILGFPIFLLIVLFRHRHKLDNKELIIKYGLFFIGLTDKGYYWEIIVVNFRKVFFIAIAVSMSKISQELQALLCFTVLYLYMSLLKYIKPYNKPYLNFTDEFSTFTSIMTLMTGMFFLDPHL